MEVDFIKNIYNFSINGRQSYIGEKFYFFNLYNMNHYHIVPFDDKSEEVMELNLKLEKMYSKNILSGQLKQFIKGPWKKHEVNFSDPIEMIVELEYPCFVVISNKLSFYKKEIKANEESEYKKNKIDFQLISEFEEQNKKYFKMVYLGNHKAIMMFKQYDFLELYSFDKDTLSPIIKLLGPISIFLIPKFMINFSLETFNLTSMPFIFITVNSLTLFEILGCK
jgi:hypothetical protein